MKNRLYSLLNTVIGSNGIKLSKPGEYIWYCPFCHHYKPKLQIQLDPNNKTFQQFNCWVCHTKGHNLFQLFKKLKVSEIKINALKDIVGVTYNNHINISNKSAKKLILPEEYLPLWNHRNTPEYKHAMLYLKSRNITDRLILKYSIGYCESGVFANRIIIPSYDENGILNFFSGRDFTNNSSMKHLLCNSTKNIIGFDFYINWNEPIVIVEGDMDAIAVRRNAIPLYGKTISLSLKRKIFEKKVKDIYILLDSDAISASLSLMQDFFNNNINVYFVNLPRESDPASVGFNKIRTIINNTTKITFIDLMNYKINETTQKRHMKIL